MAYTQTDLDNIQAAIITVASGGVAEIEINGERTRYQSLDKLVKLSNYIQDQLNSATIGSGIMKVKFKDAE